MSSPGVSGGVVCGSQPKRTMSLQRLTAQRSMTSARTSKPQPRLGGWGTYRPSPLLVATTLPPVQQADDLPHAVSHNLEPSWQLSTSPPSPCGCDSKSRGVFSPGEVTCAAPTSRTGRSRSQASVQAIAPESAHSAPWPPAHPCREASRTGPRGTAHPEGPHGSHITDGDSSCIQVQPDGKRLATVVAPSVRADEAVVSVPRRRGRSTADAPVEPARAPGRHAGDLLRSGFPRLPTSPPARRAGPPSDRNERKSHQAAAIEDFRYWRGLGLAAGGARK